MVSSTQRGVLQNRAALGVYQRVYDSGSKGGRESGRAGLAQGPKHFKAGWRLGRWGRTGRPLGRAKRA